MKRSKMVVVMFVAASMAACKKEPERVTLKENPVYKSFEDCAIEQGKDKCAQMNARDISDGVVGGSGYFPMNTYWMGSNPMSRTYSDGVAMNGFNSPSRAVGGYSPPQVRAAAIQPMSRSSAFGSTGRFASSGS